MFRLLKDFLLSGKVPSLDGLLLFDVSLGSSILLIPLAQDRLPLLDNPNGIFWLLLEDLGDIDLGFDLVTNFVRNGFKDVFKLEVILVDVPGDCPNKLQTGQERWKGFLDHWQLTHMNVLELSCQSIEELDEVLGLCMIFLEKIILLVVVVKLVTISLL
jgi:hypothetical protein